MALAGAGLPARLPDLGTAREREGGETLDVEIALDTEKRTVDSPRDFVRALKAAPRAWDRWQELSFSHQREYVESIEEARTSDTRARRIAAAVRTITSRPPRKKRSSR